MLMFVIAFLYSKKFQCPFYNGLLKKGTPQELTVQTLSYQNSLSSGHWCTFLPV